jgi:agmatine deiminase
LGSIIQSFQKNKDGRYTAIGDYVNYLEMENLIILPIFGVKEDEKVYELFSMLFGNVDIINSVDIAKEDGVLNCISCAYLL